MSRHVVILGSGIIGLCSAWYAVQRGLRVTVLDRRSAEGDNCSFGNAGMIVPSHLVPLAAPGMVSLGLRMMAHPESPFYIKPRLSWDLVAWGLRFCRAATHRHVARAAPLLRDLHLASRALYEELADELDNAFGLVRHGLLMLCKTRKTLDEEAHAAGLANRLGVPAEVLDAAQTQARDPDIRMDVAGSVYFPKDAHLTPHRLMAVLQENLAKRGVTFLWETEAQGWGRVGPRLRAVHTPRGPVEGDEFVLCGGSWSSGLAQALRLSLPMQAGKGYSLTLTQPRVLPRICAILTEARVAVTPMGRALRFGGTMEIAGLDEGINPMRAHGLIKSVPAYYPDFGEGDFVAIKPWVGLRPCSPDGLPYLGRTARYDNLVIATGHAMMGLSLGPITGQLVAEMLCGVRPAMDLRLLSPDRYRR